MENRWFKKGFKQIKFHIEDDNKVVQHVAGGSNDVYSFFDLSETYEFETKKSGKRRRRNAFVATEEGLQNKLGRFQKRSEGSLTIAAEIFELTLSLVVVKVKKKGGNKEEYERFFMYRNLFVCKF
ncbi:hypothetical protein AHAS_Ahas02G0177100 [Arachis hypogaea]